MKGQRDIKKFYNEVGFGISRKMERLKEIMSSYKCKDYSIEDYKKAFHPGSRLYEMAVENGWLRYSPGEWSVGHV